MSAIPRPDPGPLRETPEPLVRPPAPPAQKKSFSLKAWLLLALVGVAAWASYRFIAKAKGQSTGALAGGIRTAKVVRGPIQRVLRLTGSTAAKNFAMASAPMMRGAEAGRPLILIYLAKSGSSVKKGEVVAEIDAQSMKDHVDDIATQIEQAAADVTKRKAEQAINWENLEQSIRVTRAQLEKAKLDASAAEVRTTIDVELLKLSIDELEATLKQQMADLPSQTIANAAEIRILEITKERHARHRGRHVHDIERFTIQAPINGLAVMQTIWRGNEMGQIQQGDQVFPGQPFMQIVDTGTMQVQATASQVESDEMRIGQSAVVAFDAFPQLTLKAKVVSIGAIAVAGRNANNFLRTVPVYLSILDHDNRVIPDLSTASNIAVSQGQDALLVPREAVASKDGKWFVTVKAGAQFTLREIKTGISDNLHVVVLQGVQEGDEIALDRPTVVPRIS